MNPQAPTTAEERAASGDIFAFGGNKINSMTGENIPVSPTPAVVSTGAAKSAIQDSIQKLNEVTQPKQEQQIQKPQTQEVKQPAAPTTPTVATGYNIPGGPEKNPDGSPNAYYTKPTTEEKINFIPDTQIKSTGNDTIDSLIRDHQLKSDAYLQEASDLKKQLLDIQNGNYVSPQTKSLIDSISGIYDLAIGKQSQANVAVLAGFTQGGIRAGRSRYAPEIEASNLNKVMSDGIDKLTDIMTKKANAIATATVAASKNDFDQLYKMMSDFQKHSENEIKASTDLLKQVQDESKAIADAQKTNLANLKTQQSIDQKAAQGAAYTVFNFLNENANLSDEEQKKAIQEYATSNDLNPDALLNEVEKLETTKNKFYGTGPIGEYNFAKDKGGFTGSYQDWLEYKKSIGTKPTSAQNLSPSQYTKFSTLSGLDEAKSKQLADALWKEVASGADLETLRGQLKEANLDPKILDYFDTVAGIEKVRTGAKPKSSSSSF